MATEDFESGAHNTAINIGNTIFDAVTNPMQFTNTNVHSGTLAARGGVPSGGGGTPTAFATYYLLNAPSAEVYAYLGSGTTEVGDGQFVLMELMGPSENVVDNSAFFGPLYKATEDQIVIMHYDESFTLQQPVALEDVSSMGWLCYQVERLSSSSMRATILASDGVTVLYEQEFDVWDWEADDGLVVVGYQIALATEEYGGGYDSYLDDFTCPIDSEEEPPPGGGLASAWYVGLVWGGSS